MNLESALQQLESTCQAGQLTPGAVENVMIWLTEPRYAEYRDQVLEHISQGKWQQLDDAFWTIIPFGTGGRRGRMYPIGSNAINDRTIGESAQGLADYVKANRENAGSAEGGEELACAIAYDTRHRSRHFAELCAEVMVAAGFTVYFLDGYRSTPELSFAVRYKNCDCGIMVTASHNPPSDNAVKAYWSTGGQILPPHDRGVIDQVMNVEQIERQPFSESLAAGKIVACQDEVDPIFVQAVVEQAQPGPRDVKIIYSPLHGVGATAVCPVLKADGFAEVEVFGPHAEPDGDFPNVPGHVSNPENPAVFDAIIERAKQTGADLVLATDPDCDRIGCATPLSFGNQSSGKNSSDEWGTFTGNQIAALLTDFVLDSRRQAGTLSAEHYIVKTLVTTELARRIADSYGVTTCGDLQVGFKWIGGVMDERGPDRFVFGCEESHGYLVGQYARDKDAAVAAMLLSELAAQLKNQNKTLHEQLDALFWQHGAHAERLVSVTLPGSEGMAKMQSLMQRFRQSPPTQLAGLEVAAIRDYKKSTITRPDGTSEPMDSPRGNMVMLDLSAPGNYVAVRPSGTEPKVKFYMFTYEPPEQLADLDATKLALSERLGKMEQDLSDFAGG